MSASHASGTYGRQPNLARVIARFFAGLFDHGATTSVSTSCDYMSAATTLRTRIREADHARRFTRGVMPPPRDSGSQR